MDFSHSTHNELNLMKDPCRAIETSESCSGVLTMHRAASNASSVSLAEAGSQLLNFGQRASSDFKNKVSTVDYGNHRLTKRNSERRAKSRKGCSHCVTCLALVSHYHSLDARQSRSKAQTEWWPGGIHSPIVYFHVRLRQLNHQAKHVSCENSKLWRPPVVHSSTGDSLLERRGFAKTVLLIPVTCTNVSHRETSVQLIGAKTLHVSKPVVRRSSHNKVRCDADPARSEVGPTYLKRRCTHIAKNSEESSRACIESIPVLRGVQVDRGIPLRPSPFLVNQTQSQLVFPGKVVAEEYDTSHCAVHSISSQSHMIQDSKVCCKDLARAMEISPASMDASSQSEDDVFVIPVLNSTIQGHPEPTMNHYVDRQYQMKKEQAFQCHHTIEISDLTASAPKQEEGMWSTMIRTIANLGR